jgi:hypothetical protein
MVSFRCLCVALLVVGVFLLTVAFSTPSAQYAEEYRADLAEWQD